MATNRDERSRVNALPLALPGGTTLFAIPVVAVVLAVTVFWWLVRRFSEHLSKG